MKGKLLGAATAALLMAASAASFGQQGSDSSGTGMSITPGSPTAPNIGIGASSGTSREAPLGGLSRCENLIGDEREKCLKQERAAKSAPPGPAR